MAGRKKLSRLDPQMTHLGPARTTAILEIGANGPLDEMVLATKYSFGLHAFHDKSKMSKVIQANYGGNSAKSMRISLEASLKKLQTTYVDILYVHFWTYDTPVEEVMSHLNDLVSSGKVLYLGISDTPAWIVSKANAYARAHGWRPFVVYQGRWSAAERSFEREILPMCRSEGMAIVPWGALGGGAFKTEEQWKQEDRRKALPPTEAQLKIGKVLESIASKRDTVMTSVALAYVLHKAPYVFPVCGGRSIKHLDQNIEALGLQLSRDEIVQIDDAVPFDKGFPHSFMAPQVTHDEIEGPDDLMVTRMDVVIDMVKKEQPIQAGVHSNV
jgi:aryl-alcohol dehydrogenase-like predicted oxidoreductase